MMCNTLAHTFDITNIRIWLLTILIEVQESERVASIYIFMSLWKRTDWSVDSNIKYEYLAQTDRFAELTTIGIRNMQVCVVH